VSNNDILSENPRSPDNAVFLTEHAANTNDFEQRVKTAVNEKLFGRLGDSYNIDVLATLASAMDASQYATENMQNARRFQSSEALRDFAALNAKPSGMILEFGVYSGASINRLAEKLPSRELFGFDSFQGLPESWRPGYEKGAFSCSNVPTVRTNVQLVVGWFNQTLPAFIESHSHETVALLHIDCDLYSSTKTVLSLLSDQIVPNTIIVFDEYLNYPGWRLHEYKAFQEFMVNRRFSYQYIALVPSHQQVAVRIVDVP
jgi:hypothetical protein